MKKYIIGIPLVLALLMATNCKNNQGNAVVEEVDADTIILDADQYVRFETTKGNFTIKLYRETPLHRHNMVRLARKGFYDDQLFFGIKKGYKVQCGDVKSKNAKPTQEIGIDDEDGDTIASEVNPWKFYHKRGAVGQASTVQFKYSTSQQFYIITGSKVKTNTLPAQEKVINKRYRQAVKDSITQPHAKDILTWQKYGEKKKISKLNDQLNDQADAIMKTRKAFEYSQEQIKQYGEIGGAPNLDGLYTIFGEVIEGMDVVEAISLLPATGKNGRPNPDVKIIKAYVLEDGAAPAQE
ncbi:MAG: peptidylprolyl isomerase [Bacteroidaceae bacterium]|nr:peptidylprolyl isomerase [Bacteroidaceae bacterium]